MAPADGALAGEWRVTPAQLALAWLVRQRPSIVPIPGSRAPRHIAENAAAAGVTLDADQWARLDAALDQFAPAGAPLPGNLPNRSTTVPDGRRSVR